MYSHVIILGAYRYNLGYIFSYILINSHKHKVFEVHITSGKTNTGRGEKKCTTPDNFYLQDQFLLKEELKIKLTLWQLTQQPNF